MSGGRNEWPTAEAIREGFRLMLEPEPEISVEGAWLKVWARYLKHRRQRRRLRLLAAIAACILLLSFPLSTRSDAVALLVSRIEDTWLGGTLRNVREYLSSGARSETLPPPSLSLAPEVSIERHSDLDAAQSAIGVPVLVPRWLPPEAHLTEVVVTRVGGAPLSIEVWYKLPKGYLLVEEHRVDRQTGSGSMYDTEDVEVVSVSIDGVPGTLFKHKDGYVWISWAVPGYALRVETTLDPDTALRVAASLASTDR